VVRPWVLGALGAPVFLVGLLVPIRESLALLLQILIGGMYPVREGFWAASSLAAQGLCVILMAVVALAGPQGALASWAIVALLALFSLARGVASVAGKDNPGQDRFQGPPGPG